MSKRNEVTGRDNYIIFKALAYAIATIQSLPERYQEWSDMCDMCALLRSAGESVAFFAIMSAENHTGNSVDPDPRAEDAGFDAEIIVKWKAEQKAMYKALIAKNSEGTTK
jgi:hypothetical protein